MRPTDSVGVGPRFRRIRASRRLQAGRSRTVATRSGLVDQASVDPGRHHPGRADLPRGPGERVAVQHDEVGDRARRAARPASSRWFTRAEPEVYAANAVSRSRACSGRNGSVPAAPSSPYAVRLTATWMRRERVGRARPASRCPRPAGHPARCRSPNGYCQRRPLLTQERQRQLGHLVVEAGPQRLHVGGDVRAPRTGGTSSGWTSCRWAMWWRRSAAAAPGCAGVLEGVERLADAPVTDRVHVHLEALGVQRGDVRLAARSASTKEWPVLPVACPQRSRYGVAERRGAVLGDAVLHDLHAGRPEPPAR